MYIFNERFLAKGSKRIFYQEVKYPQHFTRLFKQRVGMSPNDYRGIK